MKNKQENFNSSVENVQTPTTSVPTEMLQDYFKDAYMKERERYNSMFGVLDNNPPFEYKIFKKDEQTQKTNHELLSLKRKYKKARRAKNVFVVFSLLLLGAVIFFAGSYFGLF